MSQAPLTRRQARDLEESRTRTTGRKADRRRVKVRIKVKAAPRAKASAGSKLLSLGALLGAAALLVGMSVPANAFLPESATVASSRTTEGAQNLAVSSDALANDSARDKFTVISYAQVLAEKYGNTTADYTVTTGAVRWPFPYAVPISDGFGSRVAPCASCSSEHQGVDFTPGAGTPIYAIADGVATIHSDTDGGFGNYVVLTHVINGNPVDSLYAHMQTGSSPIVQGQQVKVGDFLGLVGETGTAVGAHLHFEIHIDGVPVDPFAWLQANAVN